MTAPIHAEVSPAPSGRSRYTVATAGEIWQGEVDTPEQARAVVIAAVRGIIRLRRVRAALKVPVAPFPRRR